MATVRPRVMKMPERQEGCEGRIVASMSILVEDRSSRNCFGSCRIAIPTSRTSPMPTWSSRRTRPAKRRELPARQAARIRARRRIRLFAALVQKGWAPAERQIGQTGKTIRPKLYIAAGISGAIQHRVGVDGADLIVAINTDKNAPSSISRISASWRTPSASFRIDRSVRKRLSPHSKDRLAG